ncbi:MAG: ABC transporter ATP-binding protein/permease [Spirochaetales bacterium]|nr:ABC transporter ATP-binding protein/permease [Spirochaetales bacterium]
MKKTWSFILLTMVIKFIGTFLELLIPYVLEYIIDVVAPTKSLKMVLVWGGVMIVLAILCRLFNKTANQRAVTSASKNIYRLRQDLFEKTIYLSSDVIDHITLPSLISRLTSDSYNILSFMQSSQTLGVRAPILLLGGFIVTFSMDRGMAMILAVMAPLIIAIVVFISRKGIPLYTSVQKKLDEVVRIMRENISGIRVIKALGKEKRESHHFEMADKDMEKSEIKAGFTMALPTSIVKVFMNIGLVLVVIIGAIRVSEGTMKPGVILAFLSYFQMIMMGVLTLNRFFLMMSKANASSMRIKDTMDSISSLSITEEESGNEKAKEGYIVFDDVSFSYDGASNAVSHISFSLERGKTLGIIGGTGSGKSTIINLMMRFYDPQKGNIFVDGKNIKSYELPSLRRHFGVVFQNDFIFHDTISSNIKMGRNISDEDMKKAAENAMAAEFIERYEEGYEHYSAIHGAAFSGGQKQRLLISRALSGDSPVIVLDDSSSALDYRTDSMVRKNILSNHKSSSLVIVAERVSAVMNADEILVLHNGEIIGRGRHDHLMESCDEYRDIYQTQMGEARE